MKIWKINRYCLRGHLCWLLGHKWIEYIDGYHACWYCGKLRDKTIFNGIK